MQEKKKVTPAQMRATTKWDKENYFTTLVRFKKSDKERIRAAAGDSLNAFIVSAVLEKVEKKGDSK